MLGEVEKKILKSLNENARKSFRKMAEEVGLSTASIYNAVKKLERSGVIKGYIPVIDQQQLGYGLIAIIALSVNQGKDKEVQDRISLFPQVRAMYKMTGEWDQFLVCHFQKLEELDQFLTNQLTLPEIKRVMSHVVLHVSKDERRTLVPQ
jgi:Lrp/AsnC family transcriptional regulator for asnA, asnC and gidA